MEVLTFSLITEILCNRLMPSNVYMFLFMLRISSVCKYELLQQEDN
jgi:hypothetical protein